MKKLLAIFIALALAITLTACQSINGNGSEQEGENGVKVELSVEITEDDLNEDVSLYTQIIFSAESVTAENCTVNGTVVTITKSGTYLVSGSCSDGQILVNAKNCEVKIALNGLTLNCGSSAPIFIQKADKVIITLCDNTVNTLTDTANYVLNEDEEPSATIFSKSDLTINGSGTLTINANYNNAIQCKDILKITNGTLNVNSVDDGIIGKDFLYIQNAEINAECGGDGLRATNDSDTELGTVCIESGIFNLVCENDAIQATNGILINGGTFYITTGGGSVNSSSQSQQTPWGSWGSSTSNSDSAKGIKATNNVVINNGDFNINSSDDSVHCNDSMLISGGNFEVSSGDDGFHADNTLIISGGVINIEKSYEGIESVDITISDGDIKITASDDGINAAGGNDQSSVSGRPGQNPFGDTSNACITISGGTISIIAGGDGIDSNGNIVMTNGYIMVEGPTNDGNGALDYQNQFTFSGGTLLALGSSGMAQMPSSNSTRYSIMIGLNSYTLSTIKIVNSSGETVIEYTPSKKYSNIVFASDTLIKDSYSIYLNDVIYDEFTISSINTSVGATSGMGGIGGPPRP